MNQTEMNEWDADGNYIAAQNEEDARAEFQHMHGTVPTGVRPLLQTRTRSASTSTPTRMTTSRRSTDIPRRTARTCDRRQRPETDQDRS